MTDIYRQKTRNSNLFEKSCIVLKKKKQNLTVGGASSYKVHSDLLKRVFVSEAVSTNPNLS